MANKVWRPEQIPAERTNRAVRNLNPNGLDGRANSVSPVKPSQRSDLRGSDYTKEYSQVWEQSAEPEAAAVHDFWWDSDATP